MHIKMYFVSVFVLCSIASATLNIVELVDNNFFLTPAGFAASDIINLLCIFNASFTWLIYMIFISRYRNVVLNRSQAVVEQSISSIVGFTMDLFNLQEYRSRTIEMP